VQVAGKLFVIESGSLSFDTGEFTNPLINIISNWRAPNGVRVTAELRGTAREPSLRLTSDPALPGGESEIYALLFGGGGTAPSGAGASPALAMGAAVLTDILGATELRDVELRATEERTGGGGQSSLFDEGSVQSYVAGVQLSDEVWFEGSYKSQTGTSGEAESGVSGTLDWRFRPDWSLRTEVGSLGTGMDLLWQYRY
jgi:autotransporter translocation and assembly factor TamB